MSAAWLVWLERTAVATAMRESTWLYPIAEIAHIIGFVVLVGAAAMFDLRLLGFSRSVSVTSMARHLLPWARAGLLLVLPPGLLMFASDATLTAANPAFILKLSLIAVALLNVAIFHTRTFKSVSAWDQGVPTPPSARIAAIVSLTTWAAVIAAGRLIAYV